MKGMWRKIRIKFLFHELWVANKVLKTNVPSISLIYPMTLLIWIFAPLFVTALPLIIVLLIMGQIDVGTLNLYSQILFFLNLGLFFTVAFLVILITMLGGFPWYFTVIALIFGSKTLANDKLAKTQTKLKALTDA